MRIEDLQIYGNVRPEGYLNGMVLNDIRCISSDIEKRFGPAVNEWALGGIDFDVAEEQPCLFYPYSRPGTVIIKLAGPALTSIDFARFQLAHELVHCINPSGQKSANVLEEGMAAWYQQCYSTKVLKGRVQLGDEKYKAARQLFNKFIKKSKVKDSVIKVRTIEPYLYKVTHDVFVNAGISLPSDLETLLLARFEDFRIHKESEDENHARS